jgi:hypothetical protein
MENQNQSNKQQASGTKVSHGINGAHTTTEQSSTTNVEQQHTNQVNKLDKLQEAVQILAQAKTYDETKQYDSALKAYRQGVDILLEELIERQGNEQSRLYLRSKCNDFMNRIDQLKLIIKLQAESADNKENSTS